MKTNQGGRGPCSVSKKRKRAPDDNPAVAEVRPGGGQVPPLGTGEDAADRISLIPDAVLGEIVSLLPIKEGARTQFLASRWRHIWRSAPLNLDSGGLTAPSNLNWGGQPTKYSDHDCVVSRILTSHQAPVRRLCIPMSRGCTTVEAWLRSPALDNLKELEFGYVEGYGPTRAWLSREAPIFSLPPASIFRFATTLRLANIGKCHLLDSIVERLQFPKLKHLALQWVLISECSIHRLIAECPALECLVIYYISGLRCLRIHAVRLRSICVRKNIHSKWWHETWLEKLIIENAPCLERLFLLHLFDGLQISVISAPKLETLGYVDNDHPLICRIMKRLRADSLITMVDRLVKSLVVQTLVLDLDKIIGLMRCFPCLEKLYIQNESVYVKGSRTKNFWRRKHQNLIGCLDIRLKTIVVETYRGTMSEVNFLEFFVLNASELELMTIQVETIDEEFIAKQERLLQLEKKASRGARFQFTTDRCLWDISDICHVRDWI